MIERKGVLDFDAMQMRLHPAESRVRKLSAEIPARFIAFDVLVWKGEQVWKEPLAKRRTKLGRVAKRFELSPATRDQAEAVEWLERFEAIGLDGVVAKRRDLPYLPGSRDGVVKVKPEKTADCVVVGVRWKEKPTRLATLLLGLYDKDELHYVGSCAVAASRHDMTLELVKPLLKGAPERGFSEPNRWGTGELAESALRPELVVEVRYDKVERHRIRHGTRFLRFRPDKEPARLHLDAGTTTPPSQRPDDRQPAGMKPEEDAYGAMHARRARRPAVAGNDRARRRLLRGDRVGLHFAPFRRWPACERRAMRFVRGRVLDVGCGAGRVCLHLQDRGLDVVGVDVSPASIEVCRRRGVRDARVCAIEDVGPTLGSFDTVVMYGNNLSLLGSEEKGRRLLRRLHGITSDGVASSPARSIRTAETIPPTSPITNGTAAEAAQGVRSELASATATSRRRGSISGSRPAKSSRASSKTAAGTLRARSMTPARTSPSSRRS